MKRGNEFKLNVYFKNNIYIMLSEQQLILFVFEFEPNDKLQARKNIDFIKLMLSNCYPYNINNGTKRVKSNKHN